MQTNISKENAERLFSEYSDFVYRIALFLSKSKDQANDIVQETFIRLFQKYPTYDSSKPIGPWIYKITLNVTRNVLRKQKWLKFIGMLPENSLTTIADSSVFKNEEEKALWLGINTLSLKSREILILHFFSELKLTEISELTGLPLGTCKSRLNSALVALRIQFPKNDFDFLLEGGN